MTVSLAEATAAARRIADEHCWFMLGQSRLTEVETDAHKLAGFVLAGEVLSERRERVEGTAGMLAESTTTDGPPLAEHLLAGDTERLRTALDAELERVKALPMPLRLPGNRLGYIRGIEFARKALVEGSP